MTQLYIGQGKREPMTTATATGMTTRDSLPWVSIAIGNDEQVQLSGARYIQWLMQGQRGTDTRRECHNVQIGVGERAITAREIRHNVEVVRQCLNVFEDLVLMRNAESSTTAFHSNADYYAACCGAFKHNRYHMADQQLTAAAEILQNELSGNEKANLTVIAVTMAYIAEKITSGLCISVNEVKDLVGNCSTEKATLLGRSIATLMTAENFSPSTISNTTNAAVTIQKQESAIPTGEHHSKHKQKRTDPAHIRHAKLETRSKQTDEIEATSREANATGLKNEESIQDDWDSSTTPVVITGMNSDSVMQIIHQQRSEPGVPRAATDAITCEQAHGSDIELSPTAGETIQLMTYETIQFEACRFGGSPTATPLQW